MTGTRRIRAATPADLPALRELFLSVRQHTFVWQPPDAFHLEDFDTQTEGERVFVAEAGDRIAGFISVWEPDDFIHHLFVDTGHTRQGVGRALLQALPEWSDRQYRLKCLSRNQPALAFYHAQGFVETAQGVSDDGEYIVLSLDGHDRAENTADERK
ncbi:GNAT family N-acetyltransferase [Luteibacter sp. SG786]|uniref:GNAT family N-acetyltransferase n=1 Tax=Luteibacter sp. SG786 TaxID=2587130 RepID=UPI00141EB81F|nr:GNAT family N-acetyltransferase [Luteibacter sp. SG786]NII53482.1 GNAT superfamily N-acetyltransferase [Luteibacter sp. SG786]